MIGSAQSAHLVDSVILSRHTACLAPPNVAILRMYTSSESHFLLPAKRLALRMPLPILKYARPLMHKVTNTIFWGQTKFQYSLEFK